MMSVSRGDSAPHLYADEYLLLIAAISLSHAALFSRYALCLSVRLMAMPLSLLPR